MPMHGYEAPPARLDLELVHSVYYGAIAGTDWPSTDDRPSPRPQGAPLAGLRRPAILAALDNKGRQAAR